jgi:hypothetical protein
MRSPCCPCVPSQSLLGNGSGSRAVFFEVLVVSKESRRLVLPRTSWFVSYFTALSISLYISIIEQHKEDWWVIELEGIWKEVAMVELQYCPTVAYRKWRKQQETSVMKASVPPEIRSEYPQNTSQKRYRYTNLLDYTIKLNISRTCQAYCVCIFIEIVISLPSPKERDV